MSVKQPPVDQSNQRKLAAIVFADIKGYTALMQENEARALDTLKHFKSTIEELLEAHHGEIIQFYGDGCLLLFESSTDAVNYAKDIQKRYIERSKIPVRIGIHSGDVVIKDGNAFGDSVNIASRIESIGIPGSVLISPTVKDQLSNKSNYKMVSVGSYHFKNLDHPMEVFAMDESYLNVPKPDEVDSGKLKQQATKKLNSKLIIAAFGLAAIVLVLGGVFNRWNSNKTIISAENRQKRVAVMIFEDETNNQELANFGKQISDFITSRLQPISPGLVVSASDVREHIKLASIGSANSDKAFADATQADLLIRGRYYLLGDQLSVIAMVTDPDEGEAIFTLNPPVSGDKNNPHLILDELTQRIVGYWAVQDNPILQNKSPKYKAYELYLKAIERWGNSEDSLLIESYLKEAFKEDTTFYEAVAKLGSHYYNLGYRHHPKYYYKVDSIVHFIQTKNPIISPAEKLYLSAMYARQKGDINLETIAFEELEKLDPKNYSYSNGHVLRRANQIDLCLASMKNALAFTKPEKMSENRAQVILSYMHDMYLEREEYDSILVSMENYKDPVISNLLAAQHLRALAHTKDVVRIDSIIEAYQLSKLYVSAPFMPYLNVCYEIDVKKLDLEKDYCKIFYDQTKNLDHSSNLNVAMNKGYAQYIQGRYKDASKSFEAIPAAYRPRNGWLLSSYVKGGYLTKGKQLHDVIQEKLSNETSTAIKADNFYNLALYETALGNHDEAINYLRKAYFSGKGFEWLNYKNDTFLKDLAGVKGFEDLVRPKFN